MFTSIGISDDSKFSELVSIIAKEENTFMKMSHFNQYDKEAGA